MAKYVVFFFLLISALSAYAMETEKQLFYELKTNQSVNKSFMPAQIKSLIPEKFISTENGNVVIDCSKINMNGFELLQKLLVQRCDNTDFNRETVKSSLQKANWQTTYSVQQQFDEWNISLNNLVDKKSLSVLFKKLKHQSLETEDNEEQQDQSSNQLKQSIQKGNITDAKISQDSSCFATTTINGTAKLWKTDGTLLEKIMDGKPARKPAFSIDMTPDKLTMVIAGLDKMFVWQRANQQDEGAITPIRYSQHVYNFAKAVIKTSENGTFIIIGLQYGQTNSEMQVWQVNPTKFGSFTNIWSQNSAVISAIKISSDGTLVYCPDPQNPQNVVALYVNNGKELGWKQGGNKTAITKIETLSNPNIVITADDSGGIGVYSLDKGLLANNPSAHNAAIWAIAPANKNNTQFATGSDDNTIKIWNFDASQNALVLVNTLDNTCNATTKLQFAFGDHLLFSANRDLNTGNTTVSSWVTNSNTVNTWDSGTGVWVSDDNSLLLITLYPKGALVLDSQRLTEVLDLPPLLRAKLIALIAADSESSIETAMQAIKNGTKSYVCTLT